MGAASDDPFSNHDTRELRGHQKKVIALGWNCVGKRLATGGADGTIKIWRLEPRHVKAEHVESELTGHTNSVTYIRWDPVNLERLASISEDRTVRLWDARSSRCLGTIKAAAGLLHLSWKPDGTELAFIDRNDAVSIIDARTAKVIRTQKFSQEVNEFLWSPDGKQCFLAMGSGAIDVLDYSSLQKLRSFIGHSASVYHMYLSPDNRYLASGGSDACICLWNVSDMVCVRTFVSMDNEVNNMSFSPDSRHLAYLDKKVGICIVDVESGVMVHSISLSHVPDAIDWNPRHRVLAWPGTFQQDSRDQSRDVGSVSIFAPL